MKKIALGLTFAVMSSCVWAEWVEVSSSAVRSVVFYADSASVRKSGEKVQVLTLTDFKEAQVVTKDQQYLSARMQDEFNCTDRTGRHLNLSALSENMGNGKVVASEKKPATWRPISPETADEEMWKFACEKK